MRKILYIVIFSIAACKTEKPTPKKYPNAEENKTNTSSISDFKLYDKNNFKDTQRNYDFLGERFSGTGKTVFMNDLFYAASILPKEYYIKKYVKKADSLNVYLEKFKKEEVVQFDFQHVEGVDLFKDKSVKEVETLVKYLSFEIKNDFFAISQSGDTIPASGVHFERSFKLTPYKRLLLYFKFPKEIKQLKLVYYGKVFDRQILKFNLQK